MGERKTIDFYRLSLHIKWSDDPETEEEIKDIELPYYIRKHIDYILDKVEEERNYE